MGYDIENGILTIKMPAFHQQVLKNYPKYDFHQPSPETCNDYRDFRNSCGHAQRAYLCHHALLAFIEHGVVGCDVGSAGCVTPMCISLDIVGNNEIPEYGGVMQGVQIKGDANDLSIFCDNSLSCVVSNHVLEHGNCNKLKGDETTEQKIAIGCDGSELIELFRKHWLRVLVKGGYLVAIFPEEGAARKANHSVFHQDKQHRHAIYANKFLDKVLIPLRDSGEVEIVEYDTFRNNFSCNMVLRKK